MSLTKSITNVARHDMRSVSRNAVNCSCDCLNCVIASAGRRKGVELGADGCVSSAGPFATPGACDGSLLLGCGPWIIDVIDVHRIGCTLSLFWLLLLLLAFEQVLRFDQVVQQCLAMLLVLEG